jgi:hypothetical protein
MNTHGIEQHDGDNYVILGWTETGDLRVNLCQEMAELAQRTQS